MIIQVMIFNQTYSFYIFGVYLIGTAIYIFMKSNEYVSVKFYESEIEISYHLQNKNIRINYSDVISAKGFYNRGPGSGIRFRYIVDNKVFTFFLYDRSMVFQDFIKGKISNTTN